MLRRRGGAQAAEDIRELVLAYRQHPTDELFARLSGRLMPLVVQVATRYGSLGIPVEDLVQVGSIGLLNAIRSFDPRRGVKFETYARHLVAGEIRHFIRDQGSVVRRPRWFFELDHRVRQSVAVLTQRLGRFPTLAEIAEDIDVPEAWILRIVQARESFRLVSLDEERDGADGTPVSVYERIPEDQGSTGLSPDDRALIADAVRRLPVLQRQVIFYLFYRDLTQAETARQLGISQKHVSRIMHATLRSLRAQLYPDLAAALNGHGRANGNGHTNGHRHGGVNGHGRANGSRDASGLGRVDGAGHAGGNGSRGRPAAGRRDRRTSSGPRSAGTA